ncbi:MAG TPA: type II toxin-antitoxin system RelE/ParE family toxin [Terriglobia bacterium]|nr:type II toxin-antitoxin system RelE/ParE family toxin [Terriglobia bacterium]
MRKIEWTLSAVSDAKNIRDFIARDSKSYADRFLHRIIQAIENTAAYPMLGRSVPETPDENIREILFQEYRIMYRVETSRILVLMVIHGSRDLGQLAPKPWEVL